MILKIMMEPRSGRNWVYFEGDSISYQMMDYNELPPKESYECFSDLMDADEVALFHIIKGDKKVMVATETVSWLLNNEGKTIDRIN